MRERSPSEIRVPVNFIESLVRRFARKSGVFSGVYTRAQPSFRVGGLFRINERARDIFCELINQMRRLIDDRHAACQLRALKISSLEVDLWQK